MKRTTVLWVAALAVCLAARSSQAAKPDKPARHRIIVCTDINNAGGDPDDKQSMGHLLMYADELEIEAILPDRWGAGGIDATREAIAAYETDWNDPATCIKAPDYHAPDALRALVARDAADARRRIIEAARKDDPRPLWILVWGNMGSVKDALRHAPEIADRIRLFTIGTHLRIDGDCTTRNWNGYGRKEVFEDPRFRNLWWVESDWTYAGMFIEPGPKDMLKTISEHGALGRYIWQVVQPFKWAHYFRVGDTPSVLYLLDPDHDPDDPAAPGWAGRYIRPFPDERPNYWTGIDAGIDWNYKDPCQTWQNARAVEKARKATLHQNRQAMYNAYIKKMNRLYPQRKTNPPSAPK